MISEVLEAQKVSVASDSFLQQHSSCDFSHWSKEDVLANYNRDCSSQPFIIEVVCDSLKNGRGNALIDTGSQVSLVTAERGLNIDEHVLKIHGITGNAIETKGYVNPLNTKRRPLYLKTQFVPHCKHFSSRL